MVRRRPSKRRRNKKRKQKAQRLQRGCGRKRWYATEQDALDAAQAAVTRRLTGPKKKLKQAERLRAYRCSDCGRFHLTKLPGG